VLVRRVVEALQPAAQHLHAVALAEAREAGERADALGREVVHGGPSGGEVEALRVQVDVAQVLAGVVRPGREPRRVLAGVAQIPDVAVRVVVADVREQRGRAREVVEHLHGQRPVHVRLGRAHVGRLRALPVVGVVEERLGHVHRREVRRQLRLGLDAGEGQAPLLDQLAHRVVRAHLPLQEVGRELAAVVVDAARVALQPLPARAGTGRLDELRPADELPLVDLLDVDAELPHPAVGVRDRGVHAHGPAADPAERRPLQRADRVGGPRVGVQPLADGRVRRVAPGAAVAAADLVESAAAREHADHPGELGVHVGEEEEGAGQLVRGEHREVRERPHGIDEDHEVGVGGGEAAGLPGRDLAAAHDLGVREGLVAERGEGLADLPLHAGGEGLDVAVHEVAPVGERQDADAAHSPHSPSACRVIVIL
jgi:hypothetical protein